MLGVQHTHEAETHRTIELARIEENRRYVHFALKLLKQGRRPIDGKECSRADDERSSAVS